MLRVEHTTTFRYQGPVVASYNEARMEPLSSGRQRVMRSNLVIEPVTWTHRYVDYWGTAVTAFEVLVPHGELCVRSEVLVEVVPEETDGPTLTWEELHDAACSSAAVEHLTATPATTVPEEVVELARSAAEGLEPAEAVEAVCLALRDQLEYVPGSTTVHTPAVDAWNARTGVCQDMAHLALGALRALGVPARYASGYLLPRADQETGVTVVGESHAWIEAWVGSWVALIRRTGYRWASTTSSLATGASTGTCRRFRVCTTGRGRSATRLRCG